MDDVDRDRVERITKQIMPPIIENYRAGPSSRDRVWEALNALAFAAATVIAGTGDRDGRRAARAFFDRALSQNVSDLTRNPPAPMQ
jgi:hypothetical protein